MSDPTPASRFRFIPFRKQDVVEMCLREGRLSDQTDTFRHLNHLLASIYHFEFQHTIEALKSSYAAVDPDTDTRFIASAESADPAEFATLLGQLLEKANYERISESDLNTALTEASLFKIRLHVDFTDFAEVLLFCRGESVRQEAVPTWFGLRSKTITFTNYERVVVYIRFRPDYTRTEDQLHSCKPGSTLLKLFQNVPKADLEMLFPNTRIRMRLIDKLVIGVPAVIGGGIVLTTKLGASLILLGSLFGLWLGLRTEEVEFNQTAMIALLAGLVALGSFLWKQFDAFKNRKLRFMQTLTRNLYFKNLDNNAGVFHRLINDAEEEECKEAMLAYYFLLVSDRPLTRTELDERIESWLATKWNCEVDFEIDDAIAKLEELGLTRESNAQFSAVSMQSALEKLNRRWDDYFVPPSPNEV